ncbi:MAG: carboxypeptidase-like regulatory domain-containing protein [Balneola sp.]
MNLWVKSLLFFLSLTLSANLFSQNVFRIEGTVKTESSLEPVAGTQIFINGSTIGVLSDEDGFFILTNIPSGVHEVVVKNLGFETATITINTNDLAENYSFLLVEKVYELGEVTVKPNTQNWKYNFKEFRNSFIGLGPFSKNTAIKNKEVINFDFNIEDRTLSAFAYQRLEIENKELGYIIYFYLEEFKINYKNGTTFFHGQTFFRELSSKRKRTINKWKKNREKAYSGSFVHFTNSLIEASLRENGFSVKAEKREKDARYISKDTVSASLFFYKIDSSFFQFKFINFLNVTYEDEYEDMSYLHSIASPFDQNPRLLPDLQNSSVTLIKDSVLVDKSGFILDPTALLFDGYWGFEKVSDMLPLKYEPTDSSKK